jgi:hypothetical protein
LITICSIHRVPNVALLNMLKMFHWVQSVFLFLTRGERGERGKEGAPHVPPEKTPKY